MQTIDFINCLSIPDPQKAKITEFFRIPRRIVVASHKNPDGDAVGSAIGLAAALNDNGHEAKVVIPDDSPDYLKWLPGHELVLNYEYKKKKVRSAVEESELLIIVDLSHPDRMGEMAAILDDYEGITIQIDHHPGDGGFTDYSFINSDCGSTSELLLYFLQHFDYHKNLTAGASTCLLTGIITDTLGLRVASSYPEVFMAVMYLMKRGANKDQIYNEVYNQYGESRLRLLGFSLDSRMNIYKEWGAACIYLTKDDLNKFGYQRGDTEGFVNYPLTLKSVNLSALFTEQDDCIKLSFRSKGKVDVNVLAGKYFHGGGHHNAAGGKFFGSMEEAIEFYEKVIEKLL